MNNHELNSIIPPHGGTQFHNLIQNSMPAIATPNNNNNDNFHNNNPNTDNVIPATMPQQQHTPSDSPISDQPEGEPIPNISISSDE